jgi:exonuclease VII large subunit
MAKSGGKSKTDSKKDPPSPRTKLDVPDTGSVDKIRDILFGNQMRDFQRRFSQMEERVAKATQDLRNETYKRLETLEHFIKKEQDTLKDRLKSEADQREIDDKKLQDDLKDAAASLKKDITKAEEKLLELTSELRQQLLDQSKTLTEDIQHRHEQTSKMVHNTANGLDEAKLDRSTFSEYLIEMAMRISNHDADTIEETN